MFSSPQRGSFLSTIIQISSGADGIAVFSSPQRGSFLSTIMRERMVTRTVTRFRPLNGVLFYLHLKICLHLYSLNCFRPLNGVLFYLPCLSQPPESRGFQTGLRRKPDSFAESFQKIHIFLQNPLFYGLRSKILF